jgi:hypothetical protein
MDNPFKDETRNSRLFDVLANADRPLSPDDLAGAVGEQNPMVAHSVLKDLRRRGVTVYRYRDPDGSTPTSSVYSLRPVEGLTELSSAVRPRERRPASGPPTPVRPNVRQPQVGSIARVTGLVLADDTLRARFECDGVAYTGTVTGAQPAVGEWMTLVTVGLHGHGLYVDLAGVRAVTLQDITEVNDGQ